MPTHFGQYPSRNAFIYIPNFWEGRIMASPITLDGQLTDWTRVDRLDFNTTSVNGFAVYGHTVDGLYHFAIASDQVPIGAGTTMWLNSDQNAATGYQIFNQYLGA